MCNRRTTGRPTFICIKKLGANIKVKNGHIIAEAKKGLKGTTINFPSISVGATENALLAAYNAKKNNYKKLCNRTRNKSLILFLNKLGVI